MIKNFLHALLQIKTIDSHGKNKQNRENKQTNILRALESVQMDYTGELKLGVSD